MLAATVKKIAWEGKKIFQIGVTEGWGMPTSFLLF